MEGVDKEHMMCLWPVLSTFRAVQLSPRRTRAELSSVLAPLGDKSQDMWQKREAAAKRLAALVLGGGLDEHELGAWLTSNWRVIAEQVEDLRSQIVRTACALIVVLVNHVPGIVPHFVRWLPSLFSQLVVKSLPMRKAAEECLQYVIPRFPDDHVLRFLLSMADDKDDIKRTRTAEYLEFATQWDPLDAVANNLDATLRVLEGFITDRNADVRKSARTALASLYSPFPEFVVQVLQGCHHKESKLVVDLLPPEAQAHVTQALGSAPRPSIASRNSSGTGLRRRTTSSGQQPKGRPSVQGAALQRSGSRQGMRARASSRPLSPVAKPVARSKHDHSHEPDHHHHQPDHHHHQPDHHHHQPHPHDPERRNAGERGHLLVSEIIASEEMVMEDDEGMRKVAHSVSGLISPSSRSSPDPFAMAPNSPLGPPPKPKSTASAPPSIPPPPPPFEDHQRSQSHPGWGEPPNPRRSSEMVVEPHPGSSRHTSLSLGGWASSAHTSPGSSVRAPARRLLNRTEKVPDD